MLAMRHTHCRPIFLIAFAVHLRSLETSPLVGDFQGAPMVRGLFNGILDIGG